MDKPLKMLENGCSVGSILRIIGIETKIHFVSIQGLIRIIKDKDQLLIIDTKPFKLLILHSGNKRLNQVLTKLNRFH